MRRVTAVALAGLLAIGGYGTADVLDLVPGLITLAPEAAAYPTSPSPTSSAGATAHLPLPSAAPSGMPVAPVDTAAPLPSVAGIKAAVAPALADPDLKGAAVVVRDALTGADLLDVSGSEPRIPASTLKLIAALAVQQVFPDGTTLVTRVVQGASPDTVVLVAGGDMFLAPDKGDPAATVGRAGLGDLADSVATALRAKAITQVTVQVDTSYAPGPQVAAGWQPAFRALGIVGPVAMLGLSTQWAQSGKPGPADPVAEVVAAFAARLSERGITAVAGGRASGAGVSLGEVRSAPVTDVLGLALERSDNTVTESLARQAAFRVGRPSDFEGTAAYLREALTLAGIDPRGMSVHDASGLSRTSHVPARVLADVLNLGVKGTVPGFTQALRHLPVAGLTGTLGTRFTAAPQAPAAGLVRAKTGSLNGVNSLAGTVVTADGRMLVFAIMQEGPVGTTDARAALDRFGAALATCGCR
ncbi:MAG TPA: D-alanyl-D-alanine carboxypeptidase/D-alanyl-D-alanine-endopeptidase [Dermatophilaceae bacterium]|nr:D-alanyl-D-alanine carboxypeptidase/D-alanyl-D-alanine-endopeptidase [Dermatophilaceae bacterium]